MAGFKRAKDISRNVVQMFGLLDINCIDYDMQTLTRFNSLTIDSILVLAVP